MGLYHPSLQEGVRFIQRVGNREPLVFVRLLEDDSAVAKVESTGREIVLSRGTSVDYILDPHPEVGMGATVSFYSDRHAGTIVEVSKNGKRIVVQEDKATLVNHFQSGEPDALQFSPGGFFGHTSGQQRYTYEPDPTGKMYVATLRKDHRWRVRDADGGMHVHVGRRSHHYDYNF